MWFLAGCIVGALVTWAILHRAVVNGWYTAAVDWEEKATNSKGDS